MNPYIGCEEQLFGCERIQRREGKAKGMEFFHLKNGLGLEMEVSLDRNGDLSSLSYKGTNLSYLSPCLYVAPSYYDDQGNGFLKSFTAGFLTTCGLASFGTPSTDEGEDYPLHGSIGNTPTQNASYEVKEDQIEVQTETRDEAIFGRKMVLKRTLHLDLKANRFTLEDEIENRGDKEEPLMLLYHMNLGYPLLDEDAIVSIAPSFVRGRTPNAQETLSSARKMEKPQAGYAERCYYYSMEKEGWASLYQPKLPMGLKIAFDPKELPCFTEWKMMGVRDYVLGLEPGTNFPDGRAYAREKGLLKTLPPGEKKRVHLEISILDQEEVR